MAVGALGDGSQSREGYPSRRLPLGSPSAPMGLGLRQPFAEPARGRLGGLGGPPCGVLVGAYGACLDAWAGVPRCARWMGGLMRELGP